MPIQILMPALSPTMEEGNLAKWCVAEGDTVESGDILCEIETDKATMEVEAVDEGTIGKIVIPDGTEAVKVNELIAWLLEDGEDASSIDSAASSAPAPAAAAPAEASAAPAAASNTPAPAAPTADNGDRIFSSPLARRIAAQEGLDLTAVSGTGPRGRVVKRDIDAAIAAGTGKAPAKAEAAPAPKAAGAESNALSVDDPIFKLLPEFEAVPNTNMRKTIAKRLTESARDIPHFNLQVDVEIDKLMALRKELNSRDGADYKISVNDFLVKATSLALSRVPDCNVAYTDGAILKFKQVDMAIAVAVEGGLITPIIKDAASKGLATLANEAKDLAGRAREGKLSPEEYQGGTFTISNLGMFGIKSFNSIINPPQGGILSIGAGEQRPVVKDGALAVATVVTLTLAVDHRCIDGSTGATFIKELKGLIEDPIALML
ncbi:Dihydrolipoyllysine-residue acetyltransferase component of pyruvate dehydrogenase complex [Candidatus Terasakiella magnetica]|uniref:Acetyltransferase component of pyruvate dehydrogenase complex n=1 Tax=Candidatus Terasakiella magnetica TaxID=1867952 RepID=A0A1C3RCR3_9PROT|nr:pyruvate dehydrogenase complex dihydrolipoamide acetyltransferase [Candidatus Terasakiella magnetica]SCA55065.1 Dihydrolipoyllysine-residue acetyltransferase component of pyruvate dehydrogenase complex [Candidatus Terasakiella magnetica]